MFDGIAEHEVAEREVAERDCFFYLIAYFSICFFLIYFYLTIRYIRKSCFDVLLYFFFYYYYISRTHTGYHFASSSARLLYLYFIWNPKISLRLWPSGYRVGLRTRWWWVRLQSPMTLFFCARYFFYLQ